MREIGRVLGSIREVVRLIIGTQPPTKMVTTGIGGTIVIQWDMGIVIIKGRTSTRGIGGAKMGIRTGVALTEIPGVDFIKVGIRTTEDLREGICLSRCRI